MLISKSIIYKIIKYFLMNMAIVLIFIYPFFFLFNFEPSTYRTNTNYTPYSYAELDLTAKENEINVTSRMKFLIEDIKAFKKTKRITLSFNTESEESKFGPTPPEIYSGYIYLKKSPCFFSIVKNKYSSVINYKNPHFNTIDFYLNENCIISNKVKEMELVLVHSKSGFLKILTSNQSDKSLNTFSIKPKKIKKPQTPGTDGVIIPPPPEVKIYPIGNIVFPYAEKPLKTIELLTHVWGKYGTFIVKIGLSSLILVGILFLWIVNKRKDSPWQYVVFGTLLGLCLGVFWASIGGFPLGGNDEVVHFTSFIRATNTASQEKSDQRLEQFNQFFIASNIDRIKGRVTEKYLTRDTFEKPPIVHSDTSPELSISRSAFCDKYWKVISHFIFQYSDPGLQLWLIRLSNILFYTFSVLISLIIIRNIEPDIFVLKLFSILPLFFIALSYYASYVSNYFLLVSLSIILSAYCYGMLSLNNKLFNSIPNSFIFGVTLTALFISSTSSILIVPFLLAFFIYSQSELKLSRVNFKTTIFVPLGSIVIMLFDNKNYFSFLMARLEKTTVFIKYHESLTKVLESPYALYSFIFILIIIFYIILKAFQIRDKIFNISFIQPKVIYIKIIFITAICTIITFNLLPLSLIFFKHHASDPVGSISRSLLFGIKNVVQYILPIFGGTPSYSVSMSFWAGFGTLDALPPAFISRIPIILSGIFCFFAFLLPLFRKMYFQLNVRIIFLAIMLIILFLQAYASAVTFNFMQGRYLIPFYIIIHSLVILGMKETFNSWFEKYKNHFFLSLSFIFLCIQVYCIGVVLQRYFFV